MSSEENSMRLRPYISTDFEIIKGWDSDERTHAMWCADLFPYPLEKDSFEAVLEDHAQRFGDCAFAATDDDGRAIGFFCYSVNVRTNEGMLKFVMVDKALRGRGLGRQMLGLAVKYAFEISKADTLTLNVFEENHAAKKCYMKAGFAERSVTPNAFAFKSDTWGRCNMIIKKAD